MEKISGDSSSHSHAYRTLVSETKKLNLVEVTYNKWEHEKLLRDPIGWLSKATEKSDTIVVLIGSTDRRDSIKDGNETFHFNKWIANIVRNKTENVRDGKKIILVALHLSKSDEWPKYTNADHVSRYKLPQEFGKFQKAVFGKRKIKWPLKEDEIIHIERETENQGVEISGTNFNSICEKNEQNMDTRVTGARMKTKSLN